MAYEAWAAEQFLREFTVDYPCFADGRINYGDATNCPIVHCVPMHDDQVLLVQRNRPRYPYLWSGITGYIDDLRQSPVVETIIRRELKKEVGIMPHHIARLAVADMWVTEDAMNEKRWLVFPALAELREKPAIFVRDWRNMETLWLPAGAVATHSTAPNFLEEIFPRVLALREDI